MRASRCVVGLAGLSVGTLLTVAGMSGPIMPALAMSGSQPAAGSLSLQRVAGANRFATAAQIAAMQSPGGADVVVLANGQAGHLADALAGNYLAGVWDAPILLTKAGGMPEVTAQQLQTLGAKKVYVLGGTSAISAGQVSTLQDQGDTVVRLGGANRYETMRKIVEQPGPGAVAGFQNGGPMGILVDGADAHLADGLAAGWLAYARQLPLITTNEHGLTAAARQALQNLNIQQLLVVGGQSAISQQLLDLLQRMGITVTQQFAGSARSQTSTLLADWAINQLGFSNSLIDVASGAQQHLVDALLAGAFAGAAGTPLVETTSADDPGAVPEWVAKYAGTLTGGQLFGGVSALTPAIMQAIQDADIPPPAAGGGGGTSPPPAPSRPVLDSASVGAVSVNGAGNSVVPVTYTFDHAVTGATADDFTVYTTQNYVGPVAEGGDVCSVGEVCTPYRGVALHGTSATPAGNAVTVDFALKGADSSTDTSRAEWASSLSLAAAQSGAAVDAAGKASLPGDAPVGSSTVAAPHVLPAGVTTTPDLQSVSIVGTDPSDVTKTLADFTFDQPARDSETSAGEALTSGRYQLELTDGTTVDCIYASGSGTATITVSCDNGGTTVVTRGVVQQGAVTDSAAVWSLGNPLETVDVSTSTDPGPILGSIEVDQERVTFVFSEPVTVEDASKFFVSDDQGREYTTGTGELAAGALSEPGVDGNKVYVVVKPDLLPYVVGGGVSAGAVQDTTTSPQQNLTREVGVENTLTVPAQTPGSTGAPDLTAVTLSKDGTGHWTANYTFDMAGYPLLAGPGSLGLMQADGTIDWASSCSPSGNAAPASSTITCDQFQDSSGNPVANSDIGAAVEGVAGDGSLVVGGPGFQPNPFWAVPTG